MKDRVLNSLKNFLKANLTFPRDGAIPPLLLGYSGGSDSKALLYLLLECRDYFFFELHLAHIDHGWRQESKKQAELLRKEAEGLSLPFHLRTLSLKSFKKGNLEEQARDQRLTFFLDLYTHYGFQALLLAHQADDHGEVVLKRVCEGSHLTKLSGILKKNSLKGMQIWRPLIAIQKRDLITWLEQRSLSFINDSTNFNSQFLRGKMRVELLPLLAQGFGKKVLDNLCRLGQSAAKLSDYFHRKLFHHFQKISGGIFGSYLEFSTDLEEIEMQFLLKEWFENEKILVSREVGDEIISKVLQNQIAQFPARGGWIYLDRRRVFLIKDPLPIFPEIYPLEESSICDKRGFWRFEIKQRLESLPHTSEAQLRDSTSLNDEKLLPWQKLWKRGICTYLPQDKLLKLVPLSRAAHFKGVSDFKEKRRQMKVPSFFGNSAPLICRDNEVVFDFLTGFSKLNNKYKTLNITYIKCDLFNKQATN